MITFDKEEALKILSDPEVSRWFEGQFDLNEMFWMLLNQDVVVLFRPMSSVAWICHMAARPGTHGVRVLRSMKEAVEEFKLRVTDAKRLVACVSPENHRCQRIIQHFGFQECGYITDACRLSDGVCDIILFDRRV